MKENVASSRVSRGGAPGNGRLFRPLRRAALVTSIAIACLGGVLSCAGDRYVRDWRFNGVDLSDTLVVGESTFSLERVSTDGIELFSGRFKAGQGTWRFEIETWKPGVGEEHHFDPPVVFVCRVRLFENGIAFFAGRFVGKAPIGVFIRTPTDFDRQD
jgi:hypothetical protein